MRPSPAATLDPSPGISQFSGCHAGATIGGAWSHLNITDIGYRGFPFAARGAAGQVFSANGSAIQGGGQFGCDMNAAKFLIGTEASLGGLGLTASSLDPGTASNTKVGIKGGLNGGITERFGLRRGRSLLYGKGGWAFFNGKQSLTTSSPDYASSTDFGLFSGLQVGAGMEYHVRSRWTARIEYAYDWFPSQTFNTVNTFGQIYPFGEKLSLNNIGLGINYYFKH
ncbi:MAG TPA: outer membrane beta-barrel protein [Acidobacteriaceae bacterium]|nr:outer membrane beta-barrel protein [Acidobacteriaceae bacterium]